MMNVQRYVGALNLGKHFRSFGLLVAGLVLLTGTGGAIIYGIIWFYLSTPSTRDPGPVLTPINELVVTVFTADTTLAFLGIAGVAYAWEVKVNGIWPTDDRLLIEKLDDKRKELAKKKEAWSHPEVDDDDDDDMYGDLERKLQKNEEPDTVSARGGDFVLKAHRGQLTEEPAYVEGVIVNMSGENADHVQIDVDFYDATGTKVGEGFDMESGFPADGKWRFRAKYMGPAEDEPQGYRINSLNVE